MTLDPVGLLYLAASIATLVAALLPRLLRRAPISMPIVFVAAGVGAFALFPDLPDPDPLEHPEFALHLTELCVIVSLMGAGLAINRRFQWRTWSTTWRLLAITMPLSIVAVAFLGWWGLGLGVAGSVLLAAALAPTDPVLASEVQVSEPLTGDDDNDDDEARFAITSEAGLNDGLAFPFTYAAIAISLVGFAPGGWLGEWILVDVLWRLAVGTAVGFGAGWLLRRLFFSELSQRAGFADRADGFIALGATFLAYGAAEVVEGYGFIAVFVCACTIRAGEQSHGLHSVLHTFVEQVERLLTVVVLVLLGGAVARGLLDSLTLADYLFAAVVLLVIRPLAGWIGLTPGKTGPRERAVISFFGVRGVGSLFYIAYALQNGDFAGGDRLWAVVSLVILGSVLIHGVAATPTMAALDRARHRRAARRGHPDEEIDTPV
ncbi:MULTISPECIES: sodium:proton antiporter [unclassified Microbacterium]|uniref:cation:proton antiporter n=1 Tax=unclassified Microbacterium TaxID=2609290 RepID=UPI000EA85177|nr:MULTISPECIES: cation:proton antiporter [unclassified Microbacterium]MBT2483883.1 cation:proton antiporter [Microbacterium sp. ISL-108]RKN66863.1 sodium:proton antiporter [Microbacterium sp. CGR2]